MNHGKRRHGIVAVGSGLLGRVVVWLGLGCLVAGLWLAQSGQLAARVEPYYVVKGGAFGQISPRVLFVLDTSGSMGRVAAASTTRCEWNECEAAATQGTELESRIASARRAINNVANATSDTAKFALMTFDQVSNQTAAPTKCNDTGSDTRFIYGTHYNGNNIVRNYDAGAGAYYDGALRICQGSTRRPWPYLRWDELGVGSVIGANNAVGDPPPSPLISTAEADYKAVSNLNRRVQWFPEFLGVRVQLTSPADDATVTGSVGDYSTATEVFGQDFYYWPYVDGFPGYAGFRVENSAGNGYSGADNAGIAAGGGSSNAELYAPFYMDLTASGMASNLWGPASEVDAFDEVDAKTSPMIEGGVDVDGNTPWASVVGAVPGAITQSNAQFSHTSIASYLQFAVNAEAPDACAPTVAILLTDGDPSPGEGGSGLYSRLAALRNTLNVKTYVVGFFLSGSSALNEMACAAAGACTGACGTPCSNTPADNWDTCADPANPTTNCAYLATSTAELQAVLEGIVQGVLSFDVSAGPGSSVNEFGVGADGSLGEGAIVQTKFEAYTDYPGWQGHVVRAYCTDEVAAGVLADYCTPPAPEFTVDESQPTFGPCTQSRDWDAGECLRDMAWTDRRIYSHDGSNNTYLIAEPDGSASAPFVAELTALSLIPGADPQAESDDVVAFLLGRDAPGNWKLPGIANSAPITVRRVPKLRPQRAPEVAINDPHCAGRRFGDVDSGEIPLTLRDWAEATWDEANLIASPAPHYEYQEAVLVGDEFGILHAFQLDSGNELWGLLPRALLSNAVAQSLNGADNVGQPPGDLDNHLYGVSSTINHGWAYDTSAAGDEQWRHLAVIGFGPGGSDYLALDVSHMSPQSPLGPIEVLWTTDDTDGGRDLEYDAMLGETWVRPALAYHVQNDDLRNEPETFLVFGSGYPDDVPTSAEQGRMLVTANALTGEILERTEVPAVSGPVYEATFGALVDPAVGSHCISRYWAEAQETYIADPAGRLFRWDLGRADADPVLSFAHASDSSAGGSAWGALAEPVATFPACSGSGSTCTVAAGNRGDPFVFPAAVSSNDRIDDPSVAGNTVTERDRFLVALVSGTPNDETLDVTQGSDFHTSLYLLVDDHSSDATGGFAIPPGAPKSSGTFGAGTAFTADASYLRLALSDIERTRNVTPYPGATALPPSTANFGPGTRPIRPPRIYVTGVADPSGGGDVILIEGVEVYYVTFTVYEPPAAACNTDFFDASNNEWHYDQGSTYELTFRLTVDDATGFDFAAGSSSSADFTNGGGGAYERGLVLDSVEQVVADDCASGACGTEVGAPKTTPCDNNAAASEVPTESYAIPVSSRQLQAFSPVE